MRPAGSTAVCSTMTSPAPDSDSEPRCCRYQSFATPFSALYWHIGDTAIRLARVMPPRLSGSNREGVLSIRGPRQQEPQLRISLELLAVEGDGRLPGSEGVSDQAGE